MTDDLVQEAVNELFKGLSEKSDVDDYPCKDIPCEYWWVRYAVACTYLKNAFDKIWLPKIEGVKAKYGIISFGYEGCFDIERCMQSKRALKRFGNRKIFIMWNDSEGQSHGKAMTEDSNDGELFDILDQYIRESEKVQWQDCPYEMEHQSVCPLYKASEFYKLRKERLAHE